MLLVVLFCVCVCLNCLVGVCLHVRFCCCECDPLLFVSVFCVVCVVVLFACCCIRSCAC